MSMYDDEYPLNTAFPRNIGSEGASSSEMGGLRLSESGLTFKYVEVVDGAVLLALDRVV